MQTGSNSRKAVNQLPQTLLETFESVSSRFLENLDRKLVVDRAKISLSVVLVVLGQFSARPQLPQYLQDLSPMEWFGEGEDALAIEREVCQSTDV